MKHSNDELNAMNDVEKINAIIEDMISIVETSPINMKEVDSYISTIASNIRNFMKESKSDEISYSILRVLNNFLSKFPTVRTSACVQLDETLTKGIEDTKFEKQSLIDLKQYINNVKKENNFNGLPVSFAILCLIASMQNERRDHISIVGDVWRNGISGISYLPANTSEYKSEKSREIITNAFKELKKK